MVTKKNTLVSAMKLDGSRRWITSIRGRDARFHGAVLRGHPAALQWSFLVRQYCEKVLGGRRFTTDVERVLFALVANRAIDPASKLAAAEWASCDVAIRGLDAMDEDQAYRAMDLLIEADTDASVQEAVFFAVADLLNLEVDLLFFDTTSTYFERDTEDPDPSDPDVPRLASGGMGTPRTTVRICRRSSSGSR